MPFFYLPGNHDVGNDVADEIWDELYGVRYYSFVYKNVLFLCLNTQGRSWVLSQPCWKMSKFNGLEMN